MDFSTFISNFLANGAVVGMATFAGKYWADHKLEEIKERNAVQLESVKSDLSNISQEIKSDLDKKMMVFKTQFELEFANYQEIWALCDKSHNFAVQARNLYDLGPRKPSFFKELKKNSIARYDDCLEALNRARSLRPFMAKDIATESISFLAKALHVVKTYKDLFDQMNGPEGATFCRDDFRNEAHQECVRLADMSSSLSDMIRTRISEMYVGNFES